MGGTYVELNALVGVETPKNAVAGAKVSRAKRKVKSFIGKNCLFGERNGGGVRQFYGGLWWSVNERRFHGDFLGMLYACIHHPTTPSPCNIGFLTSINHLLSMLASRSTLSSYPNALSKHLLYT